MPRRGEYIGLGGTAGEPSAGSLSWFSADPGTRFALCDGSPYSGASLKVLANCTDTTVLGGMNTAYPVRGTTTNRDGSSTQDGSSPSGASTNGIVKIVGVNGYRYVLIYNSVLSVYEWWRSNTPTGSTWTQISFTGSASFGDGTLARIEYFAGYYWMNKPADTLGQLYRSSDGINFSVYSGGSAPSGILFHQVVDDAVTGPASRMMVGGQDLSSNKSVWTTTDGINFTLLSSSAPVYFTDFVKCSTTTTNQTCFCMANYSSSLGKLYKANGNSWTASSWVLVDDGTSTWGVGNTITGIEAPNGVALFWRSITGSFDTTTVPTAQYMLNAYQCGGASPTSLGTRTMASVLGGGSYSGSLKGIKTPTGIFWSNYGSSVSSVYWGHTTTWNATPTGTQLVTNTGPLGSMNPAAGIAAVGSYLVLQGSTFINDFACTRIGALLPKLSAHRSKNAYMRVL